MDLVTAVSYVTTYIPLVNTMFVQFYNLSNLFISNLGNFASVYIAYKISQYLWKLSIFLYNLISIMSKFLYKVTAMMYSKVTKFYFYVMNYNSLTKRNFCCVPASISRLESSVPTLKKEPCVVMHEDLTNVYGIDGNMYPSNIYKEIFTTPLPNISGPDMHKFNDSEPHEVNNIDTTKDYISEQEMRSFISNRASKTGTTLY